MVSCRTLVVCLFLFGASYGAVLSGYQGSQSLGSAYKFYSTPMTWAGANRTCTNDGARLFIINSQAEADYLKSILRSKNVGYSCWAGIRRNGNSFATVDGQPMSSTGYSAWKRTPAANTDCGIMWTCGRYGGLDCSNQKPFICEQPDYNSGDESDSDLFAV